MVQQNKSHLSPAVWLVGRVSSKCVRLFPPHVFKAAECRTERAFCVCSQVQSAIHTVDWHLVNCTRNWPMRVYHRDSRSDYQIQCKDMLSVFKHYVKTVSVANPSLFALLRIFKIKLGLTSLGCLVPGLPSPRVSWGWFHS